MMKSLSPLDPGRISCRGSISVVALILCAVGALGLLGMVSIMQARVIQVNSLEAACLRRAREANGRQLAKEVALRRIWTSAEGIEQTVELPGNWGRITVPAWDRTAFTTTMRATVYNQVGPDPRGLPYQMSVDIAVFSSVDPTTGEWVTTNPRTVSTRIQSRALANTGVLLDARSQSTTRTVSGDLTIRGKALIWQPDFADHQFSFAAEEFSGYSLSVGKANVSIENSSGAGRLAPMNFPGLTFPNWFAPAGSEIAPGTYPLLFADDWNPFASSAIAPSIDSRAQSLGAITLEMLTPFNQFGATCDGAGVMTVNLQSLNLPSLILNSPLSVVINGQTDAASEMAVENLSPLMIIIRAVGDVPITLTGNNSRPLILAIHSSSTSTSVPMSFDGGSTWRLQLVSDGQSIVLNSGGSTTLRGAIATDADLTTDAGSFEVVAETANPQWFDQLLSRSFWVETYQQF